MWGEWRRSLGLCKQGRRNVGAGRQAAGEGGRRKKEGFGGMHLEA